MALLFAVTLFLSAMLLFLVQPMIGKMVLPLLGGTPAVWNTCMVFFQAALLAGYAYAHAAPNWLGRRRQMAVHFLLLLTPLAVLPVGLSAAWIPPTDANPIPWLLGLLTVSIGLPFLVVSTSAPLLQKWFAGTTHPAAADPYFLYAASNVGSMLALFGYPLLVEPNLSLVEQGVLWTCGYLLLIGLTGLCGMIALRATRPAPVETMPQATPTHLPRGTLLHWIALAFVPSSLMLGVTTYFTTDIAAIPLLWVMPLAIYLLSFILVFARRPFLSHALMCRALPPTLLCLVFLLISGGTHQLNTGALLALHMLGLFVVSMVCHGELARLRPDANHLTTFFLCMSTGGVLGGVFNALLAPVAFTRVVEYPIALVLAGLLMPTLHGTRDRGRPYDFVLPAMLGLLTAALLIGLTGASETSYALLKRLPHGISALVVYVLPLLLCFNFAEHALRFGLGMAAILCASTLSQEAHTQVLHRERSFFGDLHLRHDSAGRYMQMFHGTTLHGMQCLDAKRKQEPLAYFHTIGPVGQIFASLESKPPRRVAIIGLGVGAMAAYAKPGQEWTYYEIDPAVTRVADDPRYFTYLRDARARGVKLNIIHGDARLQLMYAKPGEFDLLFIDAFSSDSVPVHLLTRQALELYMSKLARNGQLGFNISSRFLRLEPVLAALADDAKLSSLINQDHAAPATEDKRASTWALMARDPQTLAELAKQPGWRPLGIEPGVRVWTDDYSNILSILMW